MSGAVADQVELTLAPEDNRRLAGLCGPQDSNLQQVEERFGVRLIRRGFQITAVGKTDVADLATEALRRLYVQTGEEGELSASDVHLVIQSVRNEGASKPGTSVGSARGGRGGEGGNEPGIVKTSRLKVKARGPSQLRFVENMVSNDINFAIGPAGTGKTFLAVACGVQALLSQKVQRMVLVRPAVEAGEKLGFLPGDLAQKVDPYLRPIYDALYEMVGFERVGKLIEQGIIEVAPLAYMRGRTLNECFAILDEAQNTSPEQMKMFLTRIGFGSTAVITGDVTQIDLPPGKPSGLKHVLKVLDGVDGVTFNRFTARDVVRHPLVARIIDAYDQFEALDGK
ncbi:MAG: PhoH family protein [Immundisolibacteraceae bacterium]|nr:PhoH family protein [Immundisolibacteraceae bacterium]